MRSQGALSVRNVTTGSLKQARDDDEAARDSFIAAYDAEIGAIRNMFPRDRKRQDMFFLSTSTTRSSTKSSGGNTPPTPTPADESKSK